MPLPTPHLFSPAQHTPLLPAFAALHAACITHDHMLADFLPPLSPPAMLAFWRAQAADVALGTRAIVFTLAPSATAASEASVAGVVVLHMPVSQTEPFRGEVLKLLVSPGWRRRGMARALLAGVEGVGRERGRTLLMLDTEVGSAAEQVYVRLGYQRVGVIPRYGVSPLDGSLRDEVFFYKDLTRSALLEG